MNQSQPTYTAKEFIEMVRKMDKQGLEAMVDLLKEEEALYSVIEYGQIYKAVNLQRAMNDFYDRNKK